ncbi:MAG: hypothetical protein JNL38_14245 [Myxococcales bacterium]|jgi:protein involved in temperature-dependent protein secretion|nr:hypothetical protein [Myxococcales bacterium]
MTERIERAHALMIEGELEEAATYVRDWYDRSRSPAEGALYLSLELAMLDWAGAAATTEELRSVAPHLGALLDRVTSSAHADRERHARASDPGLAGTRQGFAPPPPTSLLYARAERAHVSGDFVGAKAALDEIARVRPKVRGTLTTTSGASLRFADLVDADDLTGAIFPVFHQGRVYDLPLADLASLELLPKADPFHWLWPSASFVAKGGTPRGTVAFPALYVGSARQRAGAIRAGRTTVFDHQLGYAVAAGLRDFWVTEEGGGKRLMGLGHFAKIEID